ncbi:hypothetical protein RCL1_005795 [Eukaryota sp. TZLM3-RCL]
MESSSPLEMEPASESYIWHDSEDETLTTDLSEAPQLRKLRQDFDETEVSASDLTQRLQERFHSFNDSISWPTRLSQVQDLKLRICCNTSWSLLNKETNSFTKPKKTAINSWNFAHRFVDNVLKSASTPSKHTNSLTFINSSAFAATHGDLCIYRSLVFSNGSVEPLSRMTFKDISSPKFSLCLNSSRGFVYTNRPFLYQVDISSVQAHRIPLISIFKYNSGGIVSTSTGPNELIAFVTREGSVQVVDGRMMTTVSSLTCEGKATTVAFNSNIANENLMLTGASNGTVSIFDMRRTITPLLSTLVNDSITCASFNHDSIAIGSNAGFMSLFTCQGPELRRLKDFSNLTTPITSVVHSFDAQFVTWFSNTSPGALRVVNSKSLTVASNYPSPYLSSHRVSSFAWSPCGGLQLIGTHKNGIYGEIVEHYGAI